MGLGPGRVVIAEACVGGRLSTPEPSAYLEAYLTRVGFSTSEIAHMRAGSVMNVENFPGYAEFLTVIPYPGSAQRFYLVHSVRARIDSPALVRGHAAGEDQARDAQRVERGLDAHQEALVGTERELTCRRGEAKGG